MKNFLSFTIFAALFLALSAMAILAAPRGIDLAGDLSPSEYAGEAPQSASASTSDPKINEIGLPLDVQASFSSAGLPFNADGLAQNMPSGETSVNQVSQWNEGLQESDTWDPNLNFGVVDGVITAEAFPLQTGGAYTILANSDADTVFTIVGDVPALGAVTVTWVGDDAACKLNHFIVPLDQHDNNLTNADLLADDIGSTAISQVTRWNAPLQESDTWDPNLDFGVVDGIISTTPFDVKIGYPYWICARSALDGVVWP